MFSLLKGQRKIIMMLAGTILIVIAVIWTMVILPAMSKLPTDLESTIVMEGTYEVLNPEVGELVKMPVTVTRVNTAVDTESGDVLIIEEAVTVTNPLGDPYMAPDPATGELGDMFYVPKSTMAVNRSTFAMVPESTVADMPREGQWTPQVGVGQDEYSIWVSALNMALPATFIGTEEIKGLEVSKFYVEAEGVSLGTDPAANNLPVVGGTKITTLVEPQSGVPVNVQSETTRSYVMPVMDPETGLPVLDADSNPITAVTPFFRSTLVYAESTVTELVDEANGAASQAFLFGTIFPWAIIGVGAGLILTPALLGISRRLFGSPVAQPAEAQVTSTVGSDTD